MTAHTSAEPIVRDIHINAPPATVFPFFTDATKVKRWLAVDATLDPRVGGVCHQTHEDGGNRYEMRGTFLEVSPPERVVFTWGFSNPEVNVPPGTSVVEVTLTPEDGGTRLRLVHRDLPASEIESHTAGWTGLL
jgi:uncharacterized protein YndB with AHSA1/START domain